MPNIPKYHWWDVPPREIVYKIRLQLAKKIYPDLTGVDDIRHAMRTFTKLPVGHIWEYRTVYGHVELRCIENSFLEAKKKQKGD